MARLTRRGLILRSAPVIAGAAFVGTRPPSAAEHHAHAAVGGMFAGMAIMFGTGLVVAI